ncbi:SPW repeat domain-containing protein [Arvimicrobium flavum]|uniref:SPW repeat domain-containing protein n=1 Tax=Arvimicrobium flavum TaxID=3393320 RepID=UPI00237C4EE3|nr:hypothetical protein [Mesorhizobium shangrilense]
MATTYGMKLAEHRRWEDILAMALGALIVLSPWILATPMFSGMAGSTQVVFNAVLTGALIIAAGGLELFSRQRWEEMLALICGVWLIVAPYALGYVGTLRGWHMALGAAVTILAVFELWQDQGRST